MDLASGITKLDVYIPKMVEQLMSFLALKIPILVAIIINMIPEMKLIGLEIHMSIDKKKTWGMVELAQSKWMTKLILAFKGEDVVGLEKYAESAAEEAKRDVKTVMANTRLYQTFPPQAQDRQRNRTLTMMQKVHGLTRKLTAPMHLVMKHMVSRHVLYHAERKQSNTTVYKDDLEALSLISLVPTNFDEACRVAKRIIRKSGLKRFKQLTSISKMQCHLSKSQMKALDRGEHVQPLSMRQYQKMASFMEMRSLSSAKEELKKEVKAHDEEISNDIKNTITDHMEESCDDSMEQHQAQNSGGLCP